MKILIIGSNGYIGSRCLEAWPDAIGTDQRIETAEDVRGLLARYNPDVVLNAAGVVGKPNVDWCETHQIETFSGNTILPLLIAEACQKEGVYLLHIGSGCVFYGEAPHADGCWHEDDFANPEAVYTKAKYAADLTLMTLPNVGIARIRMPLDCRPLPNNIIDKLAKYERIIDVANSLTVVDDMVSAFHQLLDKRATGIFHVVNPGVIKHKEIMALYEELVDPSHTNEWIKEEDLVTEGLTVKKRSTNKLSSQKLIDLGVYLRPVQEAVRDAMTKYAELKKAE